MSKEIQNKAADTLINKGVKFTLKIFGIKIKLSIKPLKLGTLIYISKASLKIKDIPQDDMLQVIGSSKENARPMASIAAYGILNGKLSILFLGRFLTYILLWKLTPKELSSLLSLTIKQSEVTDFFGCTVLTKGINLMEVKAVTSKETTPSGEQSEE